MLCCLGFFSVADTPVIPPKFDVLADYNFTKVQLSSVVHSAIFSLLFEFGGLIRPLPLKLAAFKCRQLCFE